MDRLCCCTIACPKPQMGLSENRVYSQWNSNLIGTMIINHWVQWGTNHFQTHPNVYTCSKHNPIHHIPQRSLGENVLLRGRNELFKVGTQVIPLFGGWLEPIRSMVSHQQYALNKSVVFSQCLGDEKWCVFNVSHTKVLLPQPGLWRVSANLALDHRGSLGRWIW